MLVRDPTLAVRAGWSSDLAGRGHPGDDERQLNRKRSVRAANRVGIKLVQTDDSRRTVRHWRR